MFVFLVSITLWHKNVAGSDPPSLIYQPITHEAGLSNSSVNCIYQDSSGLMWFGTWDGLNAYNGSSFRVYKPESRNEKSISNNIIRTIIEERKGVLWIATDDGINQFDATTRVFKRYYFHTGERSTHRENPYLLTKNKENLIFCAVYELGLSYFNSSKGEFIPFQIPGVNTFRLRSFFFDTEGYLWLLIGSGELYRVELAIDKEGKVQAIDSRKIVVGKAVDIFPDDQNRAWLLHSEAAASLLNCASGEITHYEIPDKSAKGRITSIVTYHDRLLMARATGGVFSYKKEGERLITDEALFATQGIFSLYKGSQDILWVGSDGQGIYKAYPNHKRFQHISDREVAGITNNPIRSFAETAEGILYVGTKGGGVYRLDYKNTGSRVIPPFSIQKINTVSGLKNDAVYALHQKNGYLWIGTDARGIQVLNTRTGHLQDFFSTKKDSNLPDFASVYAICETSDSVLWLGTSGYGLIRLTVSYSNEGVAIRDYKQYTFDKAKEKWLSSDIVYALYADEAGQSLWIGTRGGGLNRLNMKTGMFDVYDVSVSGNSISSNDVLSITGDKKGVVWIGTSYGINSLRYKPGSTIPQFTNYFDVHGLPNNTIHGIVADDEANLWITTNNGISKFIQQDNRFINYTRGDGLQSNEFSDGASYRSPYDDKIYFGGIEGFNRFRPSEIVTSNFEPPVFLNFLKLYNKSEIAVGNGIKLRYDENFFRVDFSALEYINSEKCEYAYMLENFNDDWIYTGITHSADFTNVPPGEYLLKIKATNSDRLWSSNEYSLPIQIGLPWWRSGWAYALYTVLAGVLLYFIFRLLKMRIQYHQSLWKERVNRRKEEEIHEAKLRFFTNIAHEFFTPLTLIYGPCEKINDYKFSDAYVKRHTHIIKSNAERMLSLIQQLMEFRKTESELPPLYLEDVDIPEMIKFISDSFSETIDRQQIRYSVKRDENAMYWRTDRSSLEKIVYNLLSNAVKYTPDKGEVVLEIEREESNLVIKVLNSGKGIEQEDLADLFNRFRILDNPEKQSNGPMSIRTGLGLWLTKNLAEQLGGSIAVESEKGAFTTFTVVIPAGSRQISQEIKNLNTLIDQMPALTPVAGSVLDKSNGVAATDKAEQNGRPRVLIVEDDRDIREFLYSVLAEQYSVTTAASAKEALENMQNLLPHLVISDVLMDGMNGLELTRSIKADPVTQHIPIVLLTGKREVEDQIKGLTEGADAYLPKPFYPNHLKAVIQRLLLTRQGLKEYFSSSASEAEMYNGSILKREDYEFVVRLTHLVESNLDKEELTPGFLCEETAMSKAQFSRKLKEVSGQTPSEFIRAVRLKYAARQIVSTSKTVQEIMFDSGFNNKAYFFREFNKMFGVSPREYRNEAK